VSEADYDRDFWEQRWAKALADRGDDIARMPPSPYLVAAADGLEPGRALDAGCGHGAETLWLAARGWRVTAVDFSAAALERGRASAEAAGTGPQIEWVEADLGRWAPEAGAYDLVVCLYVHVAGSAEAMVGRLAAGVAPGGRLLMAGHQPTDPETGEPTAAAGQTQVAVADAVAALGNEEWQLLTAEERRRSQGPAGVDAVIHAVRASLG
jgi:2-polyprenyl-3-methyl-5-hydroxy-6-metoxy-1,4-benzoquinol methylase